MPEDIVCVEPVYMDSDSERSHWIKCTLKWDDKRDAYVNYESAEDLNLDEDAMPDSVYKVEDKEYNSLEEAMVEAGAPPDSHVYHVDSEEDFEVISEV